MTTYNGSKYILRQLNSILEQSKLPDEVIICDDESTDNTVEIIERFIIDNKIKNWYLYRNKVNKGWRQNFYDAVSLSKGDIIFFADQDDIWYPEKIKIMSDLMKKHDMGALYAERDIINEKDELMKNRMEKPFFSGKVKKVPLANSFYAIKTIGCCMCVSRKIVDIYLALNCPDCGHDSQCGRLALLYSSLWYVDKPLIEYRIHGNNSSGVTEEGSFGQSSLIKRIKDLENDIRWMQKLREDRSLSEDKRCILNCCNTAMLYRNRYLNSGRQTSFLGLLKYRNYYCNKSMLIGDFAYRHKINKLLGKIRWKSLKLMKIKK